MSKEISTTNIVMAASLITAGSKLVDVVNINYKQAEFIIDDELENENLFINRELRLDPISLFETQRFLKSKANDVSRVIY
jgi:hypothetical protein